ncbi:MAG TPA: hypothetical protein VHR42_09700 [Clostridia bacterium]|nr:hypothetical protein [Clostridia bacterium]
MHFKRLLCTVALALTMSFSFGLVQAASPGLIESNKEVNTETLVNEIKSDKAANVSEINDLLDRCKNNDQVAIQQIQSFDCFNNKMVNDSTNDMKIDPNSSRTITFDDGSSITYTNTLTSANNFNLFSLSRSLTSSTSMVQLSSYSFPTPAKTSKITAEYKVGPIVVGHHGGSATWCDYSRTKCHLYSTNPVLDGWGISISNPSSKIVINNASSAVFSVTATLSLSQAGITFFSVHGTDVMFIETAGAMGFRSQGLA